ncbi:MAG: hypothetical protein AAB943_00595 [Patescibacteria group bacterium]
MFVGIALVLTLAYLFFIKGDEEEAALVSSSTTAVPENTNNSNVNSSLAQDFLSLLLNITSLKLDDSIFSDPAFLTLHDSSIILVPDGNEGRPNPFAPIGSDIIVTSPATLPGATTSTSGGQTPIAPI